MATERLNDIWLIGATWWHGCRELLLRDNWFCKAMAVSQAFIFHFKFYRILHFAVCQLLCWVFLLLIILERRCTVFVGLRCDYGTMLACIQSLLCRLGKVAVIFVVQFLLWRQGVWSILALQLVWQGTCLSCGTAYFFMAGRWHDDSLYGEVMACISRTGLA